MKTNLSYLAFVDTSWHEHLPDLDKKIPASVVDCDCGLAGAAAGFENPFYYFMDKTLMA